MTTENDQYYIQAFYQYAGYPKYNKFNNTYSAGCPICREGSSWGRKSRLYYIVEQSQIYCHNCGWTGNPLKWMLQVSGKTYEEIVEESRVVDITDSLSRQPIVKQETPPLPNDSINILDKSQLEYYKDNKVVRDAALFIYSRRLHTAINRPTGLYISLNDPVHKNRLCLPFYNSNDVIEHYQTRAIYKQDMINKPKYLSRINSTKTLFNINNVDNTSENVYITEGPIDACFINNGLAVAGIQESSNAILTDKQRNQLGTLILYDQIWCLDSQWLDSASYKKTSKLIELGKRVFIWPEGPGRRYKDFNDMCVEENLDFIPEEFITANTYDKMTAKVKFASVTL